MDRPRRSSSALTLDPGAILREMPVDPSTVEGAQNAVRACLGVEAGQHLVLIVESDCDALGAAFLRAADELGAVVDVHVVDERKATRESFVRTLGEQLAHADASLFVGSIDGIPSSFRRFVISAGGSKRRHGHMPGLTVAMMQQSMRTDYEEVSAITTRLAERLAGDVTITVRAPRGTDLIVRCSTALRWHAETGVLREAGWTNLPAGELLTCPSSVDGVIVPDGGMWSTDAQPVKNADRLRVVLEEGLVQSFEGGPGTDPDAIFAELDAHENGRRVGQIALGTNVGVVAATGNLLQDLKMPGFHLMLGHTSPEHTGAEWNSPIELPLLVRRADVDVEGTPILRNGRFVAPFV